jgi:hypothetical protein
MRLGCFVKKACCVNVKAFVKKNVEVWCNDPLCGSFGVAFSILCVALLDLLFQFYGWVRDFLASCVVHLSSPNTYIGAFD